jgi:hypothetical protein
MKMGTTLRLMLGAFPISQGRPVTLVRDGSPPVTANYLSGVPCPATPADRVGAHVDYFPTRAAFPK